jgi:hypothetical protein
VTALPIAPHGRSHGSRAVARNLVVRPPGRDMTNATPSRPKIASGKTLDLPRAQTHTPRGRAASRFWRNAGGLPDSTRRFSSIEIRGRSDLVSDEMDEMGRATGELGFVR